MLTKSLKINGLKEVYPIIQGGMGVGVSRSSLAGSVAREDGIGIISTAQIGYDEPEFEKRPIETNLKAIKKHIVKAKEIAEGNGLIGVNIMVATKQYADYVQAAAKAGADVIISGAGLPVDLPKYVEGYESKIAPIVSSVKAANVILKMWDRKYKRIPDFLVIEGPKAGGHLGFAKEQLDDIENLNYEEEIKGIITAKKNYEEKYAKPIPVITAGGIFDYKDICRQLELGADGVQIATRFVVTKECDASDRYKQAYIDAKKEDIKITISPVGMPGRAIGNAFIEHVKGERVPIKKCFQCLEKCNPNETPYCITKALVNAVKGDLDHGLIFCGAEVDRLHEMTTVHDLMMELIGQK